MDILRRAKIIHIDGTFKACPKNMLQVYAIHANVYDTFFPCAYVVCKNKTEKTYREIFSALKDATNGLDVNIYFLNTFTMHKIFFLIKDCHAT